MRCRTQRTSCVCTGLVSPVRAANAATSAAVNVRRSSNTAPATRSAALPAPCVEHKRLERRHAARAARTQRIGAATALRRAQCSTVEGGRAVCVASTAGPLRLNRSGTMSTAGGTPTNVAALLTGACPALRRRGRAGRCRPGARQRMLAAGVQRSAGVPQHCSSRALRASRRLTRRLPRASRVVAAAASGGAFDARRTESQGQKRCATAAGRGRAPIQPQFTLSDHARWRLPRRVARNYAVTRTAHRLWQATRSRRRRAASLQRVLAASGSRRLSTMFLRRCVARACRSCRIRV
jgi:hypothetical protein